MKIAVIGSGYVGLVTGACLAEMGNDVLCVDSDAKKIDQLKKKIVPIFEPGLEELVQRNHADGRLSFTTDIVKATHENDLIFLAVGTPPDKDYRADLSAVKAVATTIGEHMNNYKIIVTKSTVPVGTADQIKKIIRSHQPKPYPFSVVSNPEFLREGTAINDFLHPDRIVVGVDDPKAAKIMRELFIPITDDEHPLLMTDIKSAEVIKYAANTYLATKVTFINEIANFCEVVDADVAEVSRGIGLDHRIGTSFLKAGIGIGGSCFPKDLKALIHSGDIYGYNFNILESIEMVNRKQKHRLLIKLQKLIPHLDQHTIAIWGLSFKPNTDDVREAPSLSIVRRLLELGVHLNLFDPVAMSNFKTYFAGDKNIHYCQTPYSALRDVSALLVLTDWEEFLEPDFTKMFNLMKKPIILDGRNIYKLSQMRKLNFIYRSIGRPDVN